MPKAIINWALVILFAASGLTFLGQPNLITWFPNFVNMLIGIVLLISAGLVAYKEIK